MSYQYLTKNLPKFAVDLRRFIKVYVKKAKRDKDTEIPLNKQKTPNFKGKTKPSLGV